MFRNGSLPECFFVKPTETINGTMEELVAVFSVQQGVLKIKV